METIIAYDLGTSGVKASLYDENADTIAKAYVQYNTFYPGRDMHEQCPDDWWNAVVKCTDTMLSESKYTGEDVICISVSGHSLVTIPIDRNGSMLLDRVPIWSDTRAHCEAGEFFREVDEAQWYTTTGNGFPVPCYSIFKLMWLKKHNPDIFSKIHKLLGSKDYINYKLTGEIFTDHSYASGTGAYDLENRVMNGRYLAAAGISIDIFPDIVDSDYILGNLLPQAAKELGLNKHTAVVCGGVDNACMALGAVGATEGGCYVSLGSSSWIAVNWHKPVLHPVHKPYTFAHIKQGLFTSALSIFSGGNSLRWTGEQIYSGAAKDDIYKKMDEIAQSVPIGSGGVLFNPSLAGGTPQDKSPHIRGAFLNLSLGTTREEMIRAVMEGVAFNLKISYVNLQKHVSIANELLFCGGGSKSLFWMQMFADVFDMPVMKTNIDQDAASFGAAAIAFVAMNIKKDYSFIHEKHNCGSKIKPVPENAEKYNRIFPLFIRANEMMAELGEYIYNNT